MTSETDMSGMFAQRAALPAADRRNAGTKLDMGKVRFDLLPPDALQAVAQVYTFGAEKYAARNWEQGMDWGRVYAAGQRHMHAFWGGENYDPETGYLHTAHAAFGALTLTAYQMRAVGEDSRFILPTPKDVTAAVQPEFKFMDERVGGNGRVSLTQRDYERLMKAAGQKP